MRPGEGLSEDLAGVMIPACVWGLISTLVLHLIDLRSVLIQGGEGKLRWATLAFAAGVILIERLGSQEGRSTARAYVYAMGATITLFAFYHAYAFRLPAPPALVFAVNEILFLILWWVGHKVSAACSVDSAQATAAAESGILGQLKLRRRYGLPGERDQDEAQAAVARPSDPASPETGPEAEAPANEILWTKKMTGRHPGWVLLWFSLFAIPAFGLGYFVFGPQDPARFKLGAMLFIYLWCALSLLFLSSLRQLAIYFKERDVSLPEMVGLTWLAIGCGVVTFVVVLAFLLPQPPSVATLFVRERMTAVYHGWESEHGFKDGKGATGAGSESQDSKEEPLSGQNVKNRLNSRYTQIDRLKDPMISKYARTSGIEPEFQNLTRIQAGVNDGFSKTFNGFLRFILVLTCAAAFFVIYALLCVFWNRLAEGIGSLRRLRGDGEQRKTRRKKKGLEDEVEKLVKRRFRSFQNPFLGAADLRDGNALVRYLWEAMLAWCADAGSPCPPEQTPLEYVSSHPAALAGFEQPAWFIAGLFSFSEFSGQPIPESALPELKKFWTDLERHAEAAPR